MVLDDSQEQSLLEFICSKVLHFKRQFDLETESEIMWTYIEDQLTLCKFLGIDQAIVDNIDNEIWDRLD